MFYVSSALLFEDGIFHVFLVLWEFNFSCFGDYMDLCLAPDVFRNVFTFLLRDKSISMLSPTIEKMHNFFQHSNNRRIHRNCCNPLEFVFFKSHRKV